MSVEGTGDGDRFADGIWIFERDALLRDIAELPSTELRRVAIKGFRYIAEDPSRGFPLEDRGSTGDLRDCLKIYFDVDDTFGRTISLDTPVRTIRNYRIVYRTLDGDRGIQIVAIGPGHPPSGIESVYKVAGLRLGRITPNGRRVQPKPPEDPSADPPA